MLYKSHNQDEVKKGVPWAPGKNSEVSHERNANAGGEQIQIKTGTHLTWKQQYRTNSSPNKTGKPEISLHQKFEPRQTATDQNQPQVDKPARLTIVPHYQIRYKKTNSETPSPRRGTIWRVRRRQAEFGAERLRCLFYLNLKDKIEHSKRLSCRTGYHEICNWLPIILNTDFYH